MLGVPVTAVDVLYVSIPPLSATTLVSFWAYATVDQCQILKFLRPPFFQAVSIFVRKSCRTFSVYFLLFSSKHIVLASCAEERGSSLQ